jgi:hypothetical protein
MGTRAQRKATMHRKRGNRERKRLNEINNEEKKAIKTIANGKRERKREQ